jgi:biopolymer transport protein ExbD
MSMTAGNPSGRKADINMTPMIDVLLVLIIIFMVITPVAPRGLEALLPQQAAGAPPEAAPSRDIVISLGKDQSISINRQPVAPEAAPSRDIVISLGKDQSISINRQPVAPEALPERLAALYRNGPANHLFVRGARELEYRNVVHVIDAARAAGWDRIGLMTQ